jgi:basic membrane protein A
LTIFSGPLKDQQGQVKVPQGQSMTGDQILNMNWFVEGVEGTIPQ